MDGIFKSLKLSHDIKSRESYSLITAKSSRVIRRPYGAFIARKTLTTAELGQKAQWNR